MKLKDNDNPEKHRFPFSQIICETQRIYLRKFARKKGE